MKRQTLPLLLTAAVIGGMTASVQSVTSRPIEDWLTAQTTSVGWSAPGGEFPIPVLLIDYRNAWGEELGWGTMNGLPKD